jgi:hypothetical protein
MDDDPAEKAKAVRVQRFLYVVMFLMIVVPMVVYFLRYR